jgi:hypothetical protein
VLRLKRLLLPQAVESSEDSGKISAISFVGNFFNRGFERNRPAFFLKNTL